MSWWRLTSLAACPPTALTVVVQRRRTMPSRSRLLLRQRMEMAHRQAAREEVMVVDGALPRPAPTPTARAAADVIDRHTLQMPAPLLVSTRLAPMTARPTCQPPRPRNVYAMGDAAVLALAPALTRTGQTAAGIRRTFLVLGPRKLLLALWAGQAALALVAVRLVLVQPQSACLAATLGGVAVLKAATACLSNQMVVVVAMPGVLLLVTMPLDLNKRNSDVRHRGGHAEPMPRCHSNVVAARVACRCGRPSERCPIDTSTKTQRYAGRHAGVAFISAARPHLDGSAVHALARHSPCRPRRFTHWGGGNSGAYPCLCVFAPGWPLTVVVCVCVLRLQPLHLSATGPATSGSPARQPGDPTVNGGPKRGLRFITGPGATPSTVGSAPLRRQEPRRAGRRASIGAAAPEQRRPQRTSAVGFSLYGGRGKGKGKAVSAKVRLSSGAPKAAGAAPGNESAASSRDAHASEASTTAQPGVASSGAPVSSPSRRRRAKSPSAATPMPPPQNLSGKPGQPPTAPGSGASSPIAPAMPPVDSGSTPRTHNAASAQAGTANAPLDSRARGGGSELGSVTMSPIQLQTAPETGRPVSPALDLGGATRSEVPDPLADLLEPPAPRQVSHGRRAVAARPIAAGTSPIHMGPRDTAPSGSAAPQSTNPVTKPPSQPLATVPTSVDNDGGEDGLGSSQSLPLRASARRLRRRSMLLDDEQADVVTACAPGAGHGARATPRRPRRFSNGGVLSADAEGDVSMDAVPVPMLRSNDSAV